MGFLQNAWTWVIASLATVTLILRSVLFKRLRLRNENAAELLRLVREGGKAWVMEEELTEDPVPRVFTSLCWVNWTPFYLRVEERILRAGFSGTDTVIALLAFRFRYKSLIEAIRKPKIETDIPVSMVQERWPQKIGQLDIPEEEPSLYCGRELIRLLNRDIEAIKNGEMLKTGALLYGPPGNGKSYLGRYLALKHRLPIYIMALSPKVTNQNLIQMFSRLKGPAVLIMEDFDGYFDNRTPLNKEAEFTFDAFLNVLDGTYASMKGMVVLMTANNIDKVDVALKYRPSRFRYVRELTAPSVEICEEILGSNAHAFEGCSLDILLFVKDLLAQGLTLAQAKREIQNMKQSIEHAESELQKRKNAEKEKKDEEAKNQPVKAAS